MIKVEENVLTQTMPSSIRSSQKVQNISTSVEPQLIKINSEKLLTLLIARLDELGEELINELAWQLHVDFYESDAPLSQKRVLVKNAILWHKRKGTPAAVKEIFSAYFKTGVLKEWFEYGGDPYHFKLVEIGEPLQDEMTVASLVSAINETKNVRSWCDEIGFNRDLAGTMQIVEILAVEKDCIIRLKPMTPQASSGMIRSGGAIAITYKVVLTSA